jgi:iron complex outermembrane recepter protein
MKFKVLMTTASGLVLSGFLLPTTALAQQADTAVEVVSEEAVAESDRTLDRITVTGSRITRSDFTSPSPLVTTEAEDYALSGRATVDDYLRDLPQLSPGTGDFSNDSNGGTAGRATLNLRGLGPQRNLVLMDGQRLMSSGTDGAIDINTIPSLAIGNIEIISGGASATYGSDALSGVVNFKTRRDLDGFDATAQYAAPDQSGEGTWQVGAAYGTELGDGKGYFLLSAEHVDRGGIGVNERDFFLSPPVSSFTVFGRSRIGPNFLSVNDDGTIFNQGTGAGYNGPTELPFLIAGNGAVGFHGSYLNYLQVPLKRTALFAGGDYDIADATEAYFQAIFSTSEASNIGAAPNIAGAPWAVSIPGTNPFLVDLRAANPGQFGADGSPINIFQARLSQFGGRVYVTENDTFQLKAGLRGELGDSGLNWDVHASFGSSENSDRTISGAASVPALQTLLDAADGGNSICAGGYNPFGGSDPISAACLDYVERTPVNQTTLEQWVLEGVLEGKAFSMPAGEARFALNGQFRQNTYDFKPDSEQARDELANLSGSLPTKGKIEALEVGGELFLPLLRDAAILDELNLTLGYRYSDYNLAGSGDTYKAEVDARLNEMVLLRGGYQRALRAPNVGEFFLAGESRVVGIGSPPSGGDPCDVRAAPSGDVLSLCQFEGVAPNYRASTASTPAVTQGNRDLIAETADTLTAGIVFDVPMDASRFRVSLDYYTINIEDAISPVSAADSLQQCYNLQGSTPGFDPAAYLAGNFFCGNFTRSGIGELSPIQQPIRNLGSLETSGIDLAANFEMPADFLAWGGRGGSISVDANVNRLIDYSVATLPGSPSLDYAGTLSDTTGLSFPEWRALSSVTVETGPLSLIGSWRYTSSMDDRSTVLNPSSAVEGVDAFSYFDLTGRYKVTDTVSVYAGVNNIEDKEPPVVGGSASTTNPGVYDVIGRTFFIGAQAHF